MNHTTNRKKALRKVNKVARAVNKMIEKDDLWRGRFYIKQLTCNIYKFSDNSGLYGFVKYRFYDLKTGQTEDKWFNLIDFNPPFDSAIWWSMNDFIVKTCDVWRKGEDPRNDKVIYRKDNSLPIIAKN